MCGKNCAEFLQEVKMKSTVVAACTLFVAAVLIGATSGEFLGLSSKCYVCNSGSDMINCKETFGTGLIMQTASNCTCCKKDKSNDVWTRGCGDVGSCLNIINSWSCTGDLCNAASSIQIQGIIVALLSALGLAAYMRY